MHQSANVIFGVETGMICENQANVVAGNIMDPCIAKIICSRRIGYIG